MKVLVFSSPKYAFLPNAGNMIGNDKQTLENLVKDLGKDMMVIDNINNENGFQGVNLLRGNMTDLEPLTKLLKNVQADKAQVIGMGSNTNDKGTANQHNLEIFSLKDNETRILNTKKNQMTNAVYRMFDLMLQMGGKEYFDNVESFNFEMKPEET